ncbi:MAG: trigger factor [Bacteroidales bacterium]|nr:trigger factor [Bacteroidales bacterium]
MNIVKEDIDALNAVIRVSIEKEDYTEAVEKALKDYRKKANVHGFRPGMAPMGLIRKMYYRYVVADEVSKLSTDRLFDYIKEQGLKTLGEPIPTEEGSSINWEADERFEFSWELGLAPKIEVKLTKRDKFPMYKILIDDEVRSRYVESYTNRFGSYQPAQQADEKSLLRATLTELDAEDAPRDGGVSVDDASISVAMVADEAERQRLLGAKEGDVLLLDVQLAFPNEADRAALLHLKKEQLVEVSPRFQATITSVQAYVPAELNQELFDQAFGKDAVTSLEEFNSRIDSQIEQNFSSESDARFAVDARAKMLDKVKCELPKDFLLRWLTAANEGKFSREQLEAEYPAFEKDLKWQLISSHIADEHGIGVEKEEVEAYAKDYARAQFAAYGMGYLPEEYIDRYAADMLKKQDEVKRLYDRVRDSKVVEWIKDTAAINMKEISADEFFKLK